MNKEVFKERFTLASTEVDGDRFDRVIAEIEETEPTLPKGRNALIMACEELNELSQAVCKVLRGFDNRIGVLEELADVLFAIEHIKRLIGISDDDINKAINVKLEKLDGKYDDYKRIDATMAPDQHPPF